MKLEKLIKHLEKDYKSKGTIKAIVGGRSKPRGDLRYRYVEELGIPFEDWGENIKKHIDEACSCCGTIMRKKKD